MLEWAAREGRPDLTAAIEYNLAHVELLSPDPEKRRRAAERLERIGDEFTYARALLQAPAPR